MIVIWCDLHETCWVESHRYVPFSPQMQPLTLDQDSAVILYDLAQEQAGHDAKQAFLKIEMGRYFHVLPPKFKMSCFLHLSGFRLAQVYGQQRFHGTGTAWTFVWACACWLGIVSCAAIFAARISGLQVTRNCSSSWWRSHLCMCFINTDLIHGTNVTNQWWLY